MSDLDGLEGLDGLNGLNGLEDLLMTAPTDLLPGVLEEVGLADALATVDSPIGPLHIAWNGLGVRHLSTLPEHMEADRVSRRADTPPDWLQRALDTFFGGRRPQLDYDLRGLSPFEREVLDACSTVPPGQVRPYSWIAREIGRPKAVRAVGSALGRNPVPLFIPCHRIVRADGLIGNYGLGPPVKWQLLQLEGLDPSGLEEEGRHGVRLHGSDTTHIYCLPTCRYGKRVTERHQVAFRSRQEAEAAGYRACKVCKP
jgi:O-6-methylguanine DNA methyltransferase